MRRKKERITIKSEEEIRLMREAGKILADLHFTEQEKEEILSAISQHRTDGSDNVLAMLLYKADKKSRNCFSCSAASECYWPSEKKNLTIEY